MRYATIQHLKPAEFKRLTGVQPDTFTQMVSVLRAASNTFGRPAKLSVEDQLLLTLMDWREYRTQFHIAQTYAVSEATVCRTIIKVENALVQSGQFRLPGKKALTASDTLIEVVLLDATESPIERPQKNSDTPTVARKSAIPTKHKCSSTATPNGF
jgi:hypothetical protein